MSKSKRYKHDGSVKDVSDSLQRRIKYCEDMVKISTVKDIINFWNNEIRRSEIALEIICLQ